jgi:hypothetical protein
MITHAASAAVAAALLFSIAGIPVANGAELAQEGVLPPPEATPGRGWGAGGAVPRLLEIAPAPPPHPAPELPPRAGTTAAGVVSPYLGKPVSIADLEEIRRRFTMLYVDRGYINSGATIPDQNAENGVVTLRFVEGRVTDIEVTGTEHFDPEYFRSRLALAATSPFNVENMQQEQQIPLWTRSSSG